MIIRSTLIRISIFLTVCTAAAWGQSSPWSLQGVTEAEMGYTQGGTTRVTDYQFQLYRWPSAEKSKFVIWQDSLFTGLVRVTPMFGMARSTGGGDLNIDPKPYTQLAGGLEVTGDFGSKLSFWMRFHNNSLTGVDPYEVPATAELTIDSSSEDPEVLVHKIIDRIEEFGYL
ncbi:hypothetical protein ACFL6E_05860 [Candidatus Neomarinimicrobiota bacterium]